MAKILECDGCGRIERLGRDMATDPKTKHVEVIIHQTRNAYDLCDGCFRQLARQADPTKWDRVQPAPPAA